MLSLYNNNNNNNNNNIPLNKWQGRQCEHDGRRVKRDWYILPLNTVVVCGCGPSLLRAQKSLLKRCAGTMPFSIFGGPSWFSFFLLSLASKISLKLIYGI